MTKNPSAKKVRKRQSWTNETRNAEQASRRSSRDVRTYLASVNLLDGHSVCSASAPGMREARSGDIADEVGRCWDEATVPPIRGSGGRERAGGRQWGIMRDRYSRSAYVDCRTCCEGEEERSQPRTRPRTLSTLSTRRPHSLLPRSYAFPAAPMAPPIHHRASATSLSSL